MQTIDIGGVAIPRLGFGTWYVEGDAARGLVENALEAGYRHIDTAQVYLNEREVGAALAGSGIARDEIFLTTKVATERFGEGDLQRSVEESLERLGLDFVDLLLLHWPQPKPPLEETIGAINAVWRQGLTRAIGVSNFPLAELRRAVALSEAPIATNQIEYHPYLSQETQRAEIARLGTSLTAWSPLARGAIAQDPVIGGIAAKRGRSPSQIVLRWILQQPNTIAIPQTSNLARMRENLAVFDFVLDADEMTRIHALARPDGRTGDWLNPAFAWDTP